VLQVVMDWVEVLEVHQVRNQGEQLRNRHLQKMAKSPKM
jgi:hypothetical protein